MNTHKPHSVFAVFKGREDPRKQRNQIYSLFDIVTISILAVLCGADDWATIHL
ncbi:hypothetical protein NEOC84_000904|uniref:transposase family protein n=1 Tax=Neochlamydia sp. AcF84 TaxID=2315858 RepID=UPI00140C2CCC|nr:transposase family protein [Neochlamydia sp. AcF84]NGY94996.1 hypothetical protein [Neochlamydia sp. AcF84]